MTAIKATFKYKIILDFSSGKCSKNRIKQALRNCEIIHGERGEGHHFDLYINQIKVGMYYVDILLPFDSCDRLKKLRDYGDFEIAIYDTDGEHIPSINLENDSRFKDQYWVSKNTFGQLRIKHLIDIIAYCHRLDNLRAFL